MPGKPYETTFTRDGDLCFAAEIPELAHIGRRFDELSEQSSQYVAPEAEHETWRRLIARIGDMIAATELKSPPSWKTMDFQLSCEMGDVYQQAKGRVSRTIQEFFETGQMPLEEYLQWLRVAAQQAWALQGGSDRDPEAGLLDERIAHLTKRLQTAGYESEMDRRMKQQDPRRYEFMQKALGLVAESMGDPDPQAHQKLAAAQMKLFKQSPWFEQAQKAQQQMRQQIEHLRESNPQVYEQQVKQFEQLERFQADPAAAMQEIFAGMPQGESGDGEDDISSHDADDDEADRGQENDEVVATSPGQWLFSCGGAKQITPKHIELYENFLKNQHALRPQIEAALRDMHEQMHPGKPFSWPGDRVYFPDHPEQTDVPLQCFSISRANLQPKDGTVLLCLDSHFGHFDEHGCFLLIKGDKLERYGTWDEVCGDADEEWYDD